MRGGFFGLNIAVSGLYTAQRNLDVVNHNLSNVNTPGFSRQQTVTVAARPAPLYDGTGMVGTGAQVTAVNRVRNEYLDYKYWSESIFTGEWEVKQTLMDDVQATFNEPSNNGFTVVMNEFYNSIQELAKDPGSPSVRALVRQKGVSVTKYFNSLANHFEKLQKDVNANIYSKVEEINSLAVQIQQLNRQIYTAELDSNTAANDMRDQRTVLVDKLSKIVNIQAGETVVGKLPSGKDNKHFVVTISGKALVDHFNMSKLTVSQRDNRLNAEDVGGLYEVSWADGNTIDIKGGELKGYLDIRDGNEGKAAEAAYTGPLTQSAAYKGIPYYIRKLNEFVRTYAQTFNEGYTNASGTFIGHGNGYGLDGVTGRNFYTMLDPNNNIMDSAAFGGNYANLTAKNFSVSADVMNNLNAIAASDSATIQIGNITVLNDLLKMRHDPHMFIEGSPEDFMKSTVAAMGIDAQLAQRLAGNHDAIMKQVDNQRISISGVSLDEEMANLVKYQHAYNASAKMITTMAEIYDTLINRTGV